MVPFRGGSGYINPLILPFGICLFGIIVGIGYICAEISDNCVENLPIAIIVTIGFFILSISMWLYAGVMGAKRWQSHKESPPYKSYAAVGDTTYKLEFVRVNKDVVTLGYVDESGFIREICTRKNNTNVKYITDNSYPCMKMKLRDYFDLVYFGWVGDLGDSLESVHKYIRMENELIKVVKEVDINIPSEWWD